MADIRIPPAQTPGTSVARTPAPQGARAAQQAFFQAAMGQAAVGPATGQSAPGRDQPQPPVAAGRSAKPSEDLPQRLMRPGSLVDIKV